MAKPALRRTGALPELGLMTTFGATPCPDLVGVPGAPGPPIPDCGGMKGPPDGAALGVPAGDACIGLVEPLREEPFSPGGSGLFLVSFTVVVDEVGVP